MSFGVQIRNFVSCWMSKCCRLRTYNSLHARIDGALNDRVAVFIELVEIKVAMGVGQHFWIKIVKIITY